MSTIDPHSDNEQTNTLQAISEKTWRFTSLYLPGLVSMALLGACERTPESDVEQLEVKVAQAPSCGSTGRLSTQLYGSITRQISWSSEELQCESMLRPDGKGVRLRFTGMAADSRLAIILAMPELQRGNAGLESPTVVTLTVEGSGRFFSTPTLESCWSDITAQDLIDEGGHRYDVSGTLYCVAPLGEINGEAAITIPELEFRGIIDWGTG